MWKDLYQQKLTTADEAVRQSMPIEQITRHVSSLKYQDLVKCLLKCHHLVSDFQALKCL